MADAPQDDDGVDESVGTGASSMPPANFYDDSDDTPAQTHAPLPGPDRSARLATATRVLARFSARLLLVTGAVIVLGYVLGKLWTILLPVVLGLLLSTVMWPLVKLLRRWKFPPALASLLTVMLFLAAFAGIIALIAPPVTGQVTDLAASLSSGLQTVKEWLQGPPFNLGQEQIGNYFDDVINRLQSRAFDIANYAITGVSAVGTLLINAALALVLAFFFLKDGPQFLPWLAAQTGPRAAPHVAELSLQSWKTLSEFIRQQAIVGLVDATFIGLGLLVLDVPLVLPLTVITFFAAFVPILGAFVAGAFAVLIALVSNGFSTAVWVFLLVLVVQQIESNALTPVLQGKSLKLHPAVILLAVTAGGSLVGIVGAFLAVPVAALLAVSLRYARDQLDGLHPEQAAGGGVPELVGDEHGARLTTKRSAVQD